MKEIFKNRTLLMVMACIIFVGAFLLIVIVSAKNDESEKIEIYTSNYVITDLVQKIGGNKVNVICLINPGEESHGYEPSAKQMAMIEECDLIIINGLGFEKWLNNLDNEINKKIVDTSKNILPISSDGEEDNHGEYDPHIWLSIENARIQLENIKEALIGLDRNNSEYYENNYKKYELLFNLLKNEYISSFSGLSNNSIVVTHKAFAYLCDAYNLEQLSLSGIESEDEPSAADVSAIIEYIRINDVKVIFYQTKVNTKIAETISNETNVKMLQLHTLESYTKEEIESGEDYLSLMAQNLINLKEALL